MVEHRHPISELKQTEDKTSTPLVELVKAAQDVLGRKPFAIVAESKLEGIEISLQYRLSDGVLKLSEALTVGDGHSGEDLLSKVSQIQRVSQEYFQDLFGGFEFDVTGTIVMLDKTFNAINIERIEKELPPITFPYKAIAAAIRSEAEEDLKALVFVPEAIRLYTGEPASETVTEQLLSHWSLMDTFKKNTPVGGLDNEKLDSELIKAMIHVSDTQGYHDPEDVAMKLLEVFKQALRGAPRKSCGHEGLVYRIDNTTQQEMVGQQVLFQRFGAVLVPL